MTRAVCLALAFITLSAAPALAEGAWGAPSVVCRITDPSLAEMSGIAVSRRTPGVFYVHNDSGDSARLFAVSKAGTVLATITVAGAKAVDWEDMAAGYDTQGRPTLYLGDIGDNLAARPEVTVYAIPEPKIDPAGKPATMQLAARSLSFRYPDGPRDAETLMAAPDGRALYVVAKERTTAPSGIYRIEPKWDAAVQTAARIGEVRFSDPLPAYPNLSTGGDISPDGTRMVVRTYQQAYEWRIPKGKRPEDAVSTSPAVYPLAFEQQGEAICYGSNSRAWLTTTERLPAPVLMYTWSEAKTAAAATPEK